MTTAKSTFPRYLIPYVCLECRKAFKRRYEPGVLTLVCPDCDGPAHRTSRCFKAPKRNDDAQWTKVAFLLAKGFRFSTIRENGERVPYPQTLESAQSFVVKYRRFAEEPAES